MLMSRKLHFVAVPALLILLTAGAVQARPLTAQAPPEGLLTQVWQLLSQHWTGTRIKEGVGMDPNGGTPHSSVVTPRGMGAHPRRGPIGS
jgi:hypothetical protein